MWSRSVLSAALLLVLPSPELASPHLYPASTYPLGSLHQNPVYYNGFYSPWKTFQPAVQASTRQLSGQEKSLEINSRTTSSGCGSWTPHNDEAGCYKYFGGNTEIKGWEAARQKCREEGYKKGVGDADLAYFETSKELKEVIKLIPEADKDEDETAWLRGKMETDGVKVLDMDNSRWTSLRDKPFTNGIFWDGGEPVPDINTDRRLFIKKSSGKLGVAKGSYEKGFLCEYKKKACKDNTWVLDQKNQRCLKLFTEKKDWEDANEHCQTEGSTLVKLAPRNKDKLKDLTNGIVGTWVSESSTINQSTKIISFVNVAGAAVTTTDNFGLEWAVGYENYWTGTQHIFLNSKGHLGNNDGTALANFVCQHDAQGGNSEYVIKPLARSLF